jgi:Uma2 family endonuclease
VNHSLITLNVGGELRSRLKGKPCRVYDSNLRDSTETYNRTKKFDRYREIESFHEYVLVAQDGARVETFFKQVDGSWALAVATGLDAIVKLRSIEISLPLAEIYDGIAFPPESSEEPGRVNE